MNMAHIDLFTALFWLVFGIVATNIFYHEEDLNNWIKSFFIE